MFYVLAYGLATIAAFGIVALVRRDGTEATAIAQWAGLGKSHPGRRRLRLLLLAFAGIPLTSGFTAKFAAFAPAVAHGGKGGVVLVVIIGVLCSAITAFVYVRVIVLMYFTEAGGGRRRGDVVASRRRSSRPSPSPSAVIATIGARRHARPVLDLAGQASQFIR
jgi:NADH-quinone oxidoreductase subunit N